MTYFVQRWRPFTFFTFFVSLTDSRITAKEITYKTSNSNIQSGMFSNNVCAFFISHCWFLLAFDKNFHNKGSKDGVERGAGSLFFLVPQAKDARNGNDRACHSRAWTDFPLTLKKNKRILAWCESPGPLKQLKVWVYILLGKFERLIQFLQGDYHERDQSLPQCIQDPWLFSHDKSSGHFFFKCDQ